MRNYLVFLATVCFAFSAYGMDDRGNPPSRRPPDPPPIIYDISSEGSNPSNPVQLRSPSFRRDDSMLSEKAMIKFAEEQSLIEIAKKRSLEDEEMNDCDLMLGIQESLLQEKKEKEKIENEKQQIMSSLLEALEANKSVNITSLIEGTEVMLSSGKEYLGVDKKCREKLTEELNKKGNEAFIMRTTLKLWIEKSGGDLGDQLIKSSNLCRKKEEKIEKLLKELKKIKQEIKQ